MSKQIKINSHRGSYSVEIIGHKESREKQLKILKEISINSFVIIDRNVFELYPQIVANWSKESLIILEACEENKTLDKCKLILTNLIDLGFKKNMKLVAIGGGVIQDITAFISSIIFRGVDWFFLPTTLLSQADSCIGSKTSINFNNTKNLLGTFYPPKIIYTFLNFLDSLSDDDIKSGIGEILHYYLVDNNNNTLIINEEYEMLLRDHALFEKHINESLLIKRKMVEKDEFDKGPRRIFNYGHTFGHAIEVITDYKVSHGQAVTRGMDMANFIALSNGLIDMNHFTLLRQMLKKNLPSFKLDLSEIDKFITLLKKDKKSTKDQIVCILPDKTEGMKLFSLSKKTKITEYLKDYIINHW